MFFLPSMSPHWPSSERGDIVRPRLAIEPPPVGFAIHPNLVRSRNPVAHLGSPWRTWCTSYAEDFDSSALAVWGRLQVRCRRAARSTSSTRTSASSALTPRTVPLTPGSKGRSSATAVCGAAHPGVERLERADVHAAAAESASNVVPASEFYPARATKRGKTQCIPIKLA